VVVCLICNIEDLVHQLVAQLSALLLLGLLFVLFELSSALAHMAHLASRGFLHLSDETLLLFDSEVNIVLAAAFVLSLAEFAILNNNVFALGSAPRLIVKFLFLA